MRINAHGRLMKLEADRAPPDMFYLKLPGGIYAKVRPGEAQVLISAEEFEAAGGKTYTALPAQKTDC